MPARILVIDDDPGSRELARYLLAARGHVVLVARDGVEGLAILAAEEPDVVLCDLQMPKLDGYEVLARIRGDGSARKVAVIAVTAASMNADRDSALVAGFNEFITKPIDPERFVDEIEAHLDPGKRTLGRPSTS